MNKLGWRGLGSAYRPIFVVANIRLVNNKAVYFTKWFIEANGKLAKIMDNMVHQKLHAPGTFQSRKHDDHALRLCRNPWNYTHHMGFELGSFWSKSCAKDALDHSPVIQWHEFNFKPILKIRSEVQKIFNPFYVGLYNSLFYVCKFKKLKKIKVVTAPGDPLCILIITYPSEILLLCLSRWS